MELGQRLYDIGQPVYACYYSEIPLTVDKLCSSHGDYASFDHTVPNVASRAVLCSRVVNDFKALMTDDEFRRFVCEILDVSAPRKLHGLTITETNDYLSALKTVFGKENKGLDARQQLKSLSSKIRFEKKKVETPGE